VTRAQRRCVADLGQSCKGSAKAADNKLLPGLAQQRIGGIKKNISIFEVLKVERSG